LAPGGVIDTRGRRRRRVGSAIATLTLFFILNSGAADAAPDSPLNGNQQNVSNTLLDYVNRTDSIPAAFTDLSADQLSQTSGEAGAAMQQAGFAATGQFMNAVFDSGFDDAGTPNIGFGNTGTPNFGFGNTGTPNTGFGTTGTPNTGFGNTGTPNTGFGNTGTSNTGFGNTGSPNTGFGNTGTANTGLGNTGTANTGFGNTGPLRYAGAPQLSRAAQRAYAAVTPRDRAPTFEARWKIWGTAYGANATVNGDNATGSTKTTSRVYGAVAGATYRVSPATQLGFALGGGGSSFALANAFGGGKADIFTGALYARHVMGAAYVSAAAAYAWQDASTDRTVTIAGTGTLHASFHPQALTARVEGGRRIGSPAFGVAPYAALQSTTFFMPAYGESATSGSNQFALTYAAKAVTATRAELGARWDKAVAMGGGVLAVKARTAWAHDWNRDRTATATFQTLPGATFTVNGASPSANAALLSLGAELAWARGWSVAAQVDGEFSSTSRTYAGKASIGYRW